MSVYIKMSNSKLYFFHVIYILHLTRWSFAAKSVLPDARKGKIMIKKLKMKTLIKKYLAYDISIFLQQLGTTPYYIIIVNNHEKYFKTHKYSVKL